MSLRSLTNQIVCFKHTLKISGDTSLDGPCLLSFYLPQTTKSNSPYKISDCQLISWPRKPALSVLTEKSQDNLRNRSSAATTTPIHKEISVGRELYLTPISKGIFKWPRRSNNRDEERHHHRRHHHQAQVEAENGRRSSTTILKWERSSFF